MVRSPITGWFLTTKEEGMNFQELVDRIGVQASVDVVLSTGNEKTIELSSKDLCQYVLNNRDASHALRCEAFEQSKQYLVDWHDHVYAYERGVRLGLDCEEDFFSRFCAITISIKDLQSHFSPSSLLDNRDSPLYVRIVKEVLPHVEDAELGILLRLHELVPTEELKRCVEKRLKETPIDYEAVMKSNCQHPCLVSALLQRPANVEDLELWTYLAFAATTSEELETKAKKAVEQFAVSVEAWVRIKKVLKKQSVYLRREPRDPFLEKVDHLYETTMPLAKTFEDYQRIFTHCWMFNDVRFALFQTLSTCASVFSHFEFLYKNMGEYRAGISLGSVYLFVSGEPVSAPVLQSCGWEIERVQKSYASQYKEAQRKFGHRQEQSYLFCLHGMLQTATTTAECKMILMHMDDNNLCRRYPWSKKIVEKAHAGMKDHGKSTKDWSDVFHVTGSLTNREFAAMQKEATTLEDFLLLFVVQEQMRCQDAELTKTGEHVYRLVNTEDEWKLVLKMLRKSECVNQFVLGGAKQTDDPLRLYNLHWLAVYGKPYYEEVRNFIMQKIANMLES
jgi:hypothetical protein